MAVTLYVFKYSADRPVNLHCDLARRDKTNIGVHTDKSLYAIVDQRHT